MGHLIQLSLVLGYFTVKNDFIKGNLSRGFIVPLILYMVNATAYSTFVAVWWNIKVLVKYKIILFIVLSFNSY